MRRPEQRPSVKPAAAWRFAEPAKTWLANGLEVMAFHRPGQQVAAISLVLDTPLHLEGSEIEGVATLVQRCLDEGTEPNPGPRFVERLEDLGATIGGGVGFSATQVDVDVPISNLDAALELLAEVVRLPELSAADVERHRALRLAEIEQTMANPGPRAQLAFRAATIYRRCRASRPAGGRAKTVANIGVADVTDFHRRYYRPEGATLIVSGDLDESVFNVADQAFGTWQSSGQIHISHPVPEARKPHCWVIDRPGAVQADVRLGGFGIDRGDPRWADLQVAAHAMGGAFLSRLNKVLREEKGYTYGVHLSNHAMRDGGLIAMSGSFRTEVVTDALQIARDRLDLSSQPITAAEVSDAISYRNGVAPLQFQTAHAVTGLVADLVSAGLSADFVNANTAALSLVTPESATRAFSEILPAGQLSLVVVADAEKLVEPLTRAGWPVIVHD